MSDLLLEECVGWFAQILDAGIEDKDWPAVQDLYNRIVDHLELAPVEKTGH